jgi:hypothetical protein
LLSFSVLIKFENTKVILFTTLANQNTTPPSFTVYHCIAYSCGTTFSSAVAIAYLRIRIAYLILVLYTYARLVLYNHLVRLRAQNKFILFCRLLKEGYEDNSSTHSPRELI